MSTHPYLDTGRVMAISFANMKGRLPQHREELAEWLLEYTQLQQEAFARLQAAFEDYVTRTTQPVLISAELSGPTKKETDEQA